MSRLVRSTVLVFVILHFGPRAAASQETPAPEGRATEARAAPETRDGESVQGEAGRSSRWCEDQTTKCFDDGTRQRLFLSGIRFVLEPQLGVLFQTEDNRFENTTFKALEKFGLETNLYEEWVALQVLVIYPSDVTFDAASPARQEGLLVDPNGNVGVTGGVTVGASLINGIIAIGWGRVWYDRRDFVESAREHDDLLRTSFLFLNVQPVSAIKNAIRSLQ